MQLGSGLDGSGTPPRAQALEKGDVGAQSHHQVITGSAGWVAAHFSGRRALSRPVLEPDAGSCRDAGAWAEWGSPECSELSNKVLCSPAVRTGP